MTESGFSDEREGSQRGSGTETRGNSPLDNSQQDQGRFSLLPARSGPAQAPRADPLLRLGHVSPGGQDAGDETSEAAELSWPGRMQMKGSCAPTRLLILIPTQQFHIAELMTSQGTVETTECVNVAESGFTAHCPGLAEVTRPETDP